VLSKMQQSLKMQQLIVAIVIVFYKKGVILHACVHGRRKDFFQRKSLVDFSKIFFKGG